MENYLGGANEIELDWGWFGSHEYIGNGENYSGGWNLQCLKYRRLENINI